MSTSPDAAGGGSSLELSIDHEIVEGITVVVAGGWIDVTSAPQLREALITVIDEGHIDLIIDLSTAVFLDSTGLGVLVGLLHRLRTRDGSLALVCDTANDRIRKVFHITRLTQVVCLSDTVTDATEAIRTGRASAAPGGAGQ